MKFTPNDPPRVFRTGRGEPIEIKDCGRLALAPDEQVTFVTEAGGEYDVARKAWGFYATPSVNGRLLDSGLRGAIVKSFVGKYYVFLVERGHEAEAEAYLSREQNHVVRWLDNDADLRAIEAAAPGTRAQPAISCMCGGNRLTSVHMYFDRPEGETPFEWTAGTYRRELFRCSLCAHVISVHDMQPAGFYEGGYVEGTYRGPQGMRRAFDRIMALPPERSDNAGRVARILAYGGTGQAGGRHRSVLDVGSGLCVFLAAMKAAGWACTAVDPDPDAAAHARERVGVATVCGDFATAADLGRFDLITFNKVLEHVKAPIPLLARAHRFLAPGGTVYVEVPDAEGAAADGFDREEFFIEHHHVFSAASLATLARRSRFQVASIERLREPSGKYTLRAFMTPEHGERRVEDASGA